MTPLETAFLNACTGDPERTLWRIGHLDDILTDVEQMNAVQLHEDPDAFLDALHECRELARLLRAAVESAQTAIEPADNPEFIAAPARPDLALLPEPIREMIAAAIAQREREQAELLAEFEAKAQERWSALVAAVTQDLEPVLIPFANIHRRPDDWTGEEASRAVTIKLKGLSPIVVNYCWDAQAVPCVWGRAPSWTVAGKYHANLNAALLAAYDTTIEPPPF